MSFKSSIKSGIRFILNNIPAKKINVRVVSLSPNELLEGRTALITGGTSGIGFHMAKAFLRSGAAVVITGRSKERLLRTCAELDEDGAYAGRLSGLVMDNARTEKFQECFHQALEQTQIAGRSHIDIKALGEAFHITCDYPIRWREVLDIYIEVLGEKTGQRPKVLLTDKAPMMTPQVKYDRYYNRRFDNTKIGAFIDTKSFVEPYEGLRKCLETFIENPEFSGGSSRMTARLDRLTGERTPLASFEGVKRKVGYLLFRYCPTASQALECVYRKVEIL